ncbi:MAG: hypothetical protein NPIRA02_02400 [Nitrospirales bacterium]|nr:MAG: hypothetical protein NPIRA02_02400 [Nitrospirales bacterium]
MDEQTITISISPTGEVTVKAQGYRGSACEDATRALESALGVTEKRRRTPEYDLEVKEQTHVRSTH